MQYTKSLNKARNHVKIITVCQRILKNCGLKYSDTFVQLHNKMTSQTYATNLRKIANQMITTFIIVSEHIEDKRLYVVIQRFVIEEQLSQQAQILTIYFRKIALHFKNGQIVLTVDFVPWWTKLSTSRL